MNQLLGIRKELKGRTQIVTIETSMNNSKKILERRKNTLKITLMALQNKLNSLPKYNKEALERVRQEIIKKEIDLKQVIFILRVNEILELLFQITKNKTTSQEKYLWELELNAKLNFISKQKANFEISMKDGDFGNLVSIIESLVILYNQLNFAHFNKKDITGKYYVQGNWFS